MRVGTNLGVEDEGQYHRSSIDDTGVIVGTIGELKTSDGRKMKRYAWFSPCAVSSRLCETIRATAGCPSGRHEPIRAMTIAHGGPHAGPRKQPDPLRLAQRAES